MNDSSLCLKYAMNEQTFGFGGTPVFTFPSIQAAATFSGTGNWYGHMVCLECDFKIWRVKEHVSLPGIFPGDSRFDDAQFAIVYWSNFIDANMKQADLLPDVIPIAGVLTVLCDWVKPTRLCWERKS